MSDGWINPYDTPEPPPAPVTEPDFIEPPPLDDPEAEARRQGYSWPEIKDHIGSATATALQHGYSAREIDDFLGYSDPKPLQDRLGSAWSRALAIDPTAIDTIEPDVAASPTVRADYAEALIGGEVKGPRDFAEVAINAVRGALSDRRLSLDGAATDALFESGAALAAGLPTAEDLTDTALAITHAAGLPMNSETVGTAKRNLMDYWATLGGPALMDIYRESNVDPLLRDALATPKPPDELPGIAEFGQLLQGIARGVSLSADDLRAKLPTMPGFEVFGAVLGRIPVGMTVDFLREQGDVLQAVMEGQPISYFEAFSAAMAAADLRLPARPFPVNDLPGADAAISAGDWLKKTLGGVMRDTSGAGPPPIPESAIKAFAERMSAGTADADALQAARTHLAAHPEEIPNYVDYRTELDAAVGRLGKARSRPSPDLPVPEAVGDLKPIVTKLEDDLNRLRTNATADKVELYQALDRLPDAWFEPKLQEQISTEVEQRMLSGGREVAASPEVQQVLDALKGWTDKQRELGGLIRSKMNNVAIDDPSIAALTSVEEGHVHRIVKGQETRGTLADPNVEQDVITGGTPRSLSKFASGMQPRSMYVLENQDGTRVFGTKPMDQMRNPALTPEEVGKPFTRQTAQYGDVIEPPGGGQWTIKQATMAEVEANTDIRYHKNFIANTVEDLTRLQRVNRNLDFLASTGKELETQGLFIPAEPGVGIAPKDGLVKVDLPGMQGWAIPKIANPLNDFFNASRSNLDKLLGDASRFLVGSLFLSPVVHAGNVGAHWAVGRGWDWIKPSGYGSLMRDGLDALREVWTLGPRYVEHLREGSGLMYASTATENFYKTVMTKLFHEQMTDQRTWGQYARGLGFPALVDLVKAEYRWSRKTLWAANDVFLLQRQFELERKGMGTREAIFQAEKDIPNYRIPSEVMGSPAMAQFLKSPIGMNFGRYKYGQINALGLVVDDLARGSMQDRFDALGKLTVLGVMSLGAYPLLDAGLQQLTGDPNWKVRQFGPFSLIDAVRGFASGQKEWLSAFSSFMSVGPLIDILRRVSTNRDVWGRKIVDDKATWLGKVVQGLEAAAQTFYPSQLLLQGIKDGSPNKAIGGLLGATYTKPVAAADQAKWDKRDLGEAVSRERKDVIEQWLKSNLGITDVTTSPAPGRSSGGRGGGGGGAAPSAVSSPGISSYTAPQGGGYGGVADTSGGTPIYRGGSYGGGGRRIAVPRGRARTPRPANLLPARLRTRYRRGQ